jgi:hypothetical protein
MSKNNKMAVVVTKNQPLYVCKSDNASVDPAILLINWSEKSIHAKPTRKYISVIFTAILFFINDFRISTNWCEFGFKFIDLIY